MNTSTAPTSHFASFTRIVLIALFAATVVGFAAPRLRGQDAPKTDEAKQPDAAKASDVPDSHEKSDGHDDHDDHAAKEDSASEEDGPLFSAHNVFTFFMLTLLQAVLGFDNLLYISIESKRVPADKQAYVRRMGIGLAIGLRIVLLFAVMSAIKYFQEPFYSFPASIQKYLEGTFNVHSVIVILGGAFIMYTATKEISHMLAIDHLEHDGGEATRSVASAVFWIVLMNLVFSFDSILSALALTKVFAVMAAAIIVSGLMMIYLADHVAEFLHKNRMYEVLGLFVLFIVGVMLLSEGGHLAHLHLFGYIVEPMAKSTFYFVLFVLVVIEIVQSRYQKKLNAMRAAAQSKGHA